MLAHGQATEADLSERHLAWSTYHNTPDPLGNTAGDATIPGDSDDELPGLSDYYLESGGNMLIAAHTLATWQGVVPENAVGTYEALKQAFQNAGAADALDSYSWSGDSEDLADLLQRYETVLSQTRLSAASAYALDSAHLIGVSRIDMADRADVKRAIMDHGAVTAQVMMSEYPYFNWENGAYYYPGESSSNHEVVIVGWDDAYSRENFGWDSSDPDPDEGVAPPEQATALTIGAPVKVAVADGKEQWLEFTPTTDGMYRFFSSENNDDPKAALFQFDAETNTLAQIASSDDGFDEEGNLNFLIEEQLEAGVSYYLKCGCYTSDSDSEDETCEYLVSAEFVPAADPSDPDPDDSDSYTAADLRPDSDGAWLVKNSWGDEWGNGGFFWMSYEDGCLNRDTSQAVAFDVGSAANFANIYQYDGTGSCAWNYIESGGSVGNVFTASANSGGSEDVRAVSFELEDANVDYSVQVYANVRANGAAGVTDPTAGTPMLAAPVTGSTTYPGYYTVNLPAPVRVAEGSRYSVVMTLSHADGSDVAYSVDSSSDHGWIKYNSSVAPGQSFECDSPGAAWDDLSSEAFDGEELAGGLDPETGEAMGDNEDIAYDESMCCARLKAFTSNVTTSTGGTTGGGTTGGKSGSSAQKTFAMLDNPLKVSGKTVKVKAGKKRVVKAAKAYKFKHAGAGSLTYARIAKGSSKWLTVNSRNGAITVKKRAPKKQHKIKVAITAQGDSTHNPITKKVIVKIRLK